MNEIPTSRSESNRKLTLAERAAMRASSGLYFLEDHLIRSKGGTDAAYSRSRYILLSYNFELILKSWLILVSSFQEEGQIIERLKTHNLEKLFKMRPKDTFLDIQIENITKGELNGFTEYHMTLVGGETITLQDFVDVRYDFNKDSLRSFNSDEVERLKNEIEIMLKMVKIIHKHIEVERDKQKQIQSNEAVTIS